MPINPKYAQDVWKDIGESVQFTVLKFKDLPVAELQEAFTTFVGRYKPIVHSLRIRDGQPNGLPSSLKIAFGLSNHAWDILYPNTAKPKELEDFAGVQGPKYAMPATEGDLFFHIRANNQAVVYEAQEQFMRFLKEITEVVDSTQGFRYFEGRAIIGFIDGTEAPESYEAADYAIIGDEDEDFINGSYAFAQKWRHNMDFWNKMKTEHQEKAIGREKFTDLELEDEDKYHNAHNVASQYEENGEEQKIIRMNVPYSDPASGNTGTYFMGYARHWRVTKGMLQNMVDQSDYLLTFSEILTGQLFFIPSRTTLEAMADGAFS
ncbi:Dyp-type peroxidase [Leuconostocaceae bacterium ESL0958]|nr:Dyp-type peroxidase [Leuconostocaceae bacterium ESL0958]